MDYFNNSNLVKVGMWSDPPVKLYERYLGAYGKEKEVFIFSTPKHKETEIDFKHEFDDAVAMKGGELLTREQLEEYVSYFEEKTGVSLKIDNTYYMACHWLNAQVSGVTFN
jgi:hypothetical protein